LNPSNKKIAPSLVALSSAAVLTIYAAGYLRTRSAAEQFAVDGAQRRTAGPAEASPVALPAPPPADPVPASPESKPEASAPPSRKTSPQAAPAPAAASTSAPVAESTEASVAPIPAAPSVLPTGDPTVPADADLRTPEPPAAPPVAPQPQYKDGTYSGWGTSRHGDIQATVIVEGGRIASAVISQCWTRYSCSWIAALPPQVVSRQSPNVDYVSGATQSTNAFYYAVVEALSKAK
jgi:uncharacterized protein with FMN-binding domain